MLSVNSQETGAEKEAMKNKNSTITQKPEYYNEEKTVRNQSLYKDKKAGMSTVDLVIKYQITPARIMQIIESIEKKAANVNN